MHKLFYILLPILLTLASCDEDPFSTTVDIPIPAHEPGTALTMDIRSGDDNLYYRIALSRSVLEEAESTNALGELLITRNGEPFFSATEAMVTTDGQSITYALPNTFPSDVATYEVTAKVEGMEPVTAQQTMPAAVEIRNINYERDGAIDIEGFRIDKLDFDLIDDPNTEDYYAFTVGQPQYNLDCVTDPDTGEGVCDTAGIRYLSDFYITSPDPLLKMEDTYGMVITDEAFSGSRHRIRLQVDNYYDESVILEVYHLTEDAYRVALSHHALSNAIDNPFAEPINVHGNVEGGYGYFTLANRQRYTIE